MTFNDLEQRTVRANCQLIHVRIGGESGPLVLLCHGFPESSYSWRHQIQALAGAGYRVVSLAPSASQQRTVGKGRPTGWLQALCRLS
ncbi:alpha/beta fold hydrolase [Roseomonas sp. TAS13]|uniref:alpha/beta fold hydrolase n=1 Tax=Roseomonas sp. TAS13 TaxID=1926319 RepID=UPI000A07A6A5|nr:alpha/beta fold hydrolase [Roseomonas sp. TAS13]